MYRLNRSQAQTLSNLIRRFNTKAKSIGFNDFYEPEYKSTVEMLSNKRDYNKVINRLKSFLKPGAEKIYINENGVKYTRWERDQLRFTQRAANRMRDKLLAKYREETNYRQIPTETELTYRPRYWDIKGVKGRSDLKSKLTTQLHMSLGGYDRYRDQKFIDNYLKHLNKFPSGLPYINKLKYQIYRADRDVLIKVLRNSSFADTIDNHYEFMEQNPDGIERVSEEIYERFLTGIKYYQGG